MLAKCFSACLLISMVCSAVFARLDWLNQFGAADRSVFLFERLFQLFEDVSCRLPESLCAAGRVDACRLCRTVFFFCVCDCLRSFSLVLLCMACSAPQLPLFVGMADFFNFELTIRQVERWTAYYRLLFLSTSRAVAPRFLLFS